MSNATTATVESVNSTIGALTPELHDLGVQDAQAMRSSHELRDLFIAGIAAIGKTSKSFDVDVDPEFHKEMMSISRDSLGAKSSAKGLTEEEVAELSATGDGCYYIATVIDPEIKPAALPAYITEANRIGNLSIRKYWQQQANAWYRSVQRSMQQREKQVALLAGGASARTKLHAEKQSDALKQIVSRHRKCEEPALLPNECAYLVKVIDRLATEHDLKPMDDPEAK